MENQTCTSLTSTPAQKISSGTDGMTDSWEELQRYARIRRVLLAAVALGVGLLAIISRRPAR